MMHWAIASVRGKVLEKVQLYQYILGQGYPCGSGTAYCVIAAVTRRAAPAAAAAVCLGR
jgi:hypothetical protein